MVSMRHLTTAFSAGEIDPLMYGRVDTTHYAAGLQLCENFVCINEGPLVKRPGFEYVCDADPSSSWLGTFRFSITQEYVIEWGERKSRFFTNEARIETAPGVAYECATPYAAVDCPGLSTQQSYDRLYLDHGNYPPAALARTSATTFVHANSVLVGGPFSDQNVQEGISVSAGGGTAVGTSVTLIATAAIFEAGHVGAPFRIEAQDFSDIKAWEPGMALIGAGEIVRSEGKAYQAVTSGSTGTIQPLHSSGAEWDGQDKKDVLNAKGPYGVKWQYLHDRFGTVTITGFTSSTVVTATVTKALPGSVAAGSWRWSHGAFSDAAGYPSLVLIHAGRQIHVKGFEIYGSVVGDYGGGTVNFSTLTSAGALTADLAFRRTLATENPPLWIAGDRKILLGTASRELAVGAINSAVIISGDNISAEPQSFYGSEPIAPVQVGTQTIFIERAGRRIRAAGYDFSRDRYAAVDMTVAARHVTRPGIVQLAYQREPYALLTAVRSDGQLVTHAATQDDMKGFSRTVLGGGARAITAVSIVGQDGRNDELWALIERETPAGTRREIWRQTAWRDVGDAIEQSFFVDGGVKVEAAAGQTHFSGAVHLANQPVAVLANGGVVDGIIVAADGSFDLPATAVPAFAYTVVVGLRFTAEAVTLPPELRPNGQTSVGMIQIVRKAYLRVLDTLGLRVGPDEGATGPLDRVHDRAGNDAMDAAVPPVSGFVEGYIDARYDADGRVRLLSDVPLPAIINSSVLKIDLEQRDV